MIAIRAIPEPKGGADVRSHRERIHLVALLTLQMTAACVDGEPSGTDAETPAAESTDVAVSPVTPAETQTGTFLLDLTTGSETPLPDELSEGVVYAASPDGTMIAFSTYSRLYGSADDVMSIASIDGTDARTIPVPDGLNGYVSEWSPDSTKVLYQGRQGGSEDLGNLFVYDIATEKSTRLTDLPLASAEWYEIHTDFSPDGREVLFHMPRTDSLSDPKFDIFSVPMSGGEPRLAVRDAAFPMYVSGGKEIAFVMPSRGGFSGRRIAILSADGSRRTLLLADDGIYRPQESPDGTRIAYAVSGSIIATMCGAEMVWPSPI